jgi:hypothetical protein
MREDFKENKWTGRPFNLLEIDLFVDNYLGTENVHTHQYTCMQPHSSNLGYDHDLHEVWLMTLKFFLRPISVESFMAFVLKTAMSY